MRSANDGSPPPDEHAEDDGAEHDREHLEGLAELQAEGLVAREEQGDREVRDERERHDRDDRVDGGERDVQRHIAAEEMAEEIRRRAAGRRREQHHPHREHWRQPEEQHEAQADRRQDEQLAGERDDHRPRMLRDASEILRREAQPEAEHDDAEGDGQSDGGQR
jgi:hypothetical protein